MLMITRKTKLAKYDVLSAEEVARNEVESKIS
jgi:hypothetical protein